MSVFPFAHWTLGTPSEFPHTDDGVNVQQNAGVYDVAMRRPKFTVLLVLVCCAWTCRAQTGDWSKVEQLHHGEPVKLRVTVGRQVCNFVSADDSALHCEYRRSVFFVPVRHRMEFPRADVLEVRLSRQGLSTLAGAAIGAGAGAGIGAGIDAQAKDQQEEGHLVTVLLGFLGAVIGGGVGQHTDFLAGPVVYRAP